jgi:general secretion pathway protein H
MRDQRGFSLIEILVVLVIISVFTSLAVLTLESVQGRNNDEEVLRLQRLLEMAADYSDTRGTPLAVEFLPNGYRFSAMQTNGEWRLIFAPSPFAERSWPEGGTGGKTGNRRSPPERAPAAGICFGTAGIQAGVGAA